MYYTDIKEFRTALESISKAGFNTRSCFRVNADEDVFRFEIEEEAKEVTKLGFKGYQTEHYMKLLDKHIETLPKDEDGKTLPNSNFNTFNFGEGWDFVKKNYFKE